MVVSTPDISFHVASLRFADKLLASGKFDALISIGHPNGTENCARRAKWSLMLNMWDITPFRGRRKGLLPIGEDVLKVVEFAQALPAGSRLLVHCKKGRSRSTATLLTALVSRGLGENEAVDALLSQHPRSCPNGWLLKLADAILETFIFDAADSRGIVKWR